MYKRELCKNWSESGACRYGNKCQFAHGFEELSDNHQLYMNEQKAGVNDKYKSQNCRQFYREKLCPYGKRCHFRHEYRSFKKIHRHYYIAHLSAVALTHEDILVESKSAPDGGCEPGCDDSFEGSSSSSKSSFGLGTDVSTQDGSEQQVEDSSAYPRRLSVFQTLMEAAEDGKSTSLKLTPDDGAEETQEAAELAEHWSQASSEEHHLLE